MEEKVEKMKAITEEVVNLTASPLYNERIKNEVHPVVGEGSYEADIMMVGEAPGKNESLTGRPFCGSAGKILDELLKHVDIEREDVYITNIVKDRPPMNRDPSADEINIYAPFLDRQIDIIKPRILAPLGRHAMRYIFYRYVDESFKMTISEVRGRKFKAKFSYGEVFIVPLYHPAVAIYNSSRKDELKKDFEVLRSMIKEKLSY